MPHLPPRVQLPKVCSSFAERCDSFFSSILGYSARACARSRPWRGAGAGAGVYAATGVAAFEAAAEAHAKAAEAHAGHSGAASPV